MLPRSAPRAGAAVLATCLFALPGVLLRGRAGMPTGPAAAVPHAGTDAPYQSFEAVLR